MVDEVIRYLDPKNGDVIVDSTLGGGGHSAKILEKIVPEGILVGIDQDDDAIAASRERFKEFERNVIIRKGNFSQIKDIITEAGFDKINGVLFDLGVSSHQLNTPDRGFSFRDNSVLDMRMDRSQNITAEMLVNTFNEHDLADIIYKYGEERWAKRIAKFIVERRKEKPIRHTKDLVEVVLAAIPAGARNSRIHPATKTFQAIRIYVNKELESLEKGLRDAIGLLEKGGVICVLSYHSLEDRIVKNIFAEYAGRCTCPKDLPICVCGAKTELDIITHRPLKATEQEISCNPRSRSAKLRAARKAI